MSLAKSFFTISGLTLISRILGFIRDILLAAALGAGPLAQVFLVAFKLPNFFRRLFGEGAFNAAFVPMFAGTFSQEGPDEARRFARNVFSFMLMVLVIFSTVIMLAMPWVMLVLAPGFVGQVALFDLAVELTRITFPYLALISLVALMTGVLNSLGKFAAGAGAPILLNLCLITVLLFFMDAGSTEAHALAVGVAVAGLLQWLMLFIACKRAGQGMTIVRPRLDTQTRTFLKRMVPGIIGAGVMQINLWVDVMIATFLPGAIAFLYYADRVNQLPLALIGTAMGVALLPSLSKHIRKGEHEAALNSQNRALELVLFFTLPAMVGLVVLAEPVIRILFERGAFTPQDSTATAWALMAYASGLPAFVIVKIFAASFFASGDTKTPVIVASMCLFVNVTLNFTLVWLLPKAGIMPHVGLALATSIASWVNVWLLHRKLYRERQYSSDDRLRKRGLKMVAAAGMMGAVLWLGLHVVGALSLGSAFGQLVMLVMMIGVGAGLYLGLCFMCHACTVENIKGFVRQRKD